MVPWSFGLLWMWHTLLQLTVFFSRKRSRSFTHSGCRWWTSQTSSLVARKLQNYTNHSLRNWCPFFDDLPFQLLTNPPFCPIKGHLKPWKTNATWTIPSLPVFVLPTGCPVAEVRWISKTYRPSVAASCPPPCAQCPETPSRSSLLPGWHSCGIRCGLLRSICWVGLGVLGWKGTRKAESSMK